MIFGESKPDEEVKMTAGGGDKAIFPLAVPSIASPGAMLAAVLMTENGIYSFGNHPGVSSYRQCPGGDQSVL